MRLKYPLSDFPVRKTRSQGMFHDTKIKMNWLHLAMLMVKLLACAFDKLNTAYLMPQLLQLANIKYTS